MYPLAGMPEAGIFRTFIMKYIIISLKHGTGTEPIFWRANNAGYTNSPFEAGHYTEEQVKAEPNYYNDGYSAVAIPLTDHAMSTIDFTCRFDEKAIEKFFEKSKA
jgi:hypothetical protein